MSVREDLHHAHVEALLELRQTIAWLATEYGSLAQLYKAPPPSGVLFSGSYTINSAGHRAISFPVPFAAVMIVNLGATTLTVADDEGTQGTAPNAGPGVFHIPAGGYRLKNIASRHFVLYGQVGALVDVTVFERPQTESAGAASLVEPVALFTDGVDTAVTNAAPVQLLAADTTRRVAQVTNTGANPMRVGGAAVTVNGGFLRLAGGQSAVITSQQALYGIAEATATTALASSGA